jgi:hypothetical protein
MHKYILLLFLFLPYLATAQYDGAAGTTGSQAIYKNDFRFRDWATTCTVQRGYQDINRQNLGFVASGSEAGAIGRAGDGQVLTLGDAGAATVGFSAPIYDGSGIDFVVFENGFSDIFLELAFVEVSSDGVHFFRFPAISNSDTSTQIGTFGAINPTYIYNLAGKYRANYGVGFDLSELADIAAQDTSLDLQNIRFVRIIDVIGSIEGANISRDSRGYKINDPYPTAFDTGGFDLDAVGVFHSQAQPVGLQVVAQSPIFALRSSNILSANQSENIRFENSQAIGNTAIQYIWSDATGRVIASGKLPNPQEAHIEIITPTFQSAGIYYLLLLADNQKAVFRFVAQ